MKRAKTKKQRKNNTFPIKLALYKKFGKKCMLCESEKNLQAHHIIRRSDGGKDTLENLAIVCNTCHKVIHQSTDNEQFYGILLQLLKSKGLK